MAVSESWLEYLLVNVYYIIPFILQLCVIFSHLINFSSLNCIGKILWSIGYISIQCLIGYLIIIPMPLIILLCFIEIFVLFLIEKCCINNYLINDHIILLFIDLNLWLWIIFDDILSCIFITITCEIMILSSDTKYNSIHLRNIITYFISKILLRNGFMSKFNLKMYLFYLFIPISLAILCKQFKLKKNDFFGVIYICIHVSFWVYYHYIFKVNIQ